MRMQSTRGTTGTPGLIWYTELSRINRIDLTLNARLCHCEKMFSLLHSMLEDKTEFKTLIEELDIDIKACQNQYESALDRDDGFLDKQRKFRTILFDIEKRLDKLLNKSKLLDAVGIGEVNLGE